MRNDLPLGFQVLGMQAEGCLPDFSSPITLSNLRHSMKNTRVRREHKCMFVCASPPYLYNSYDFLSQGFAMYSVVAC